MMKRLPFLPMLLVLIGLWQTVVFAVEPSSETTVEGAVKEDVELKRQRLRHISGVEDAAEEEKRQRLRRALGIKKEVDLGAVEEDHSNESGIFDEILARFEAVATKWADVLIKYASWLFWGLALISIAWTYAMLALQDDLQSFWVETVKFLVTMGFFWWVLKNGPQLSMSIINSMAQIGADVINADVKKMTPSSMVGVGFSLFHKTITSGNWLTDPVDMIMATLASLWLMAMMSVLAFNFLRLYIMAWFMGYGGVFMLGFAGSSWTSFIAVNYLKNVIGLSVQVMGTILVAGVGKSFMDKCLENFHKYTFSDFCILIFAISLLVYLLQYIPPVLTRNILDAGRGVVHMLPAQATVHDLNKKIEQGMTIAGRTASKAVNPIKGKAMANAMIRASIWTAGQGVGMGRAIKAIGKATVIKARSSK